MIHANHAGQIPKIDATAYVHTSAMVVGNVDIGAKVFVGPNAVIRSDEPCAQGKVESITDLAAFAEKVRRTNIFLTEASAL